MFLYWTTAGSGWTTNCSINYTCLYADMTCCYILPTGNAWQQKKEFEIVRQSQPFGNLSGDSGLFFIGYAASPENFEFMLDRMVGAGGDGHSDLIMTMTKCIKGTYWYFPGQQELKQLA